MTIESMKKDAFPYGMDIGKTILKSPEALKPISTYSYKFEDIRWRNVIAFIYLHVASFYGIYLLCIGEVKLSTFVFGYFTAGFAALGVTAGAHRLWAHNGYKAKWPVKVLWTCFNSMAFQNSIYEWSRDHRAHHKFTDTDADPHNYSRGFFFAHMGWLMIKKHPEVKRKGATIDMSDLEQDPIVMFQKKYYHILMPLWAFVIPPLLCQYVTGDTFANCWHMAGILKYTMSLHWAWLVNSAAHVWGSRPYDKSINPADNRFVALVTYGEGWHNYHHVFPWDYKAAELHTYGLNLCTWFIDVAAWCGQAYDLRTVSDELIRARALRTGDLSLLNEEKHRDWVAEMVANGKLQQKAHEEVDHVWGWNDPDLSTQDKRFATIRKKALVD